MVIFWYILVTQDLVTYLGLVTAPHLQIHEGYNWIDWHTTTGLSNETQGLKREGLITKIEVLICSDEGSSLIIPINGIL